MTQHEFETRTNVALTADLFWEVNEVYTIYLLAFKSVRATINTALPVPWTIIQRGNSLGYTTSMIKRYLQVIISPLITNMMA